MPKPSTKKELLRACEDNFSALKKMISSLEPAKQTSEFQGKTLNRNIRDVLAHLHHWHLLFFKWYKDGMSEIKPVMPAKGYKWKDLPKLNQWIWQEYQSKSLKNTKIALNRSYKKMIRIIESHSDKELFEKKRYFWTGTTSLAAYVMSNSSSHYHWAIKQIRKGLK